MRTTTDRGAPLKGALRPQAVEWGRRSDGAYVEERWMSRRPEDALRHEEFCVGVEVRAAAHRMQSFGVDDLGPPEHPALQQRHREHAAWAARVWLVGAAAAAVTWRDRDKLRGRRVHITPRLVREAWDKADWHWSYDLRCRGCGIVAGGGNAEPSVSHDDFTPLRVLTEPCWGIWHVDHDPAVVASCDRCGPSGGFLPRWLGGEAVICRCGRVVAAEWRTHEDARINAVRRFGVEVTPTLLELGQRWCAIERRSWVAGDATHADERSAVALEALAEATLSPPRSLPPPSPSSTSSRRRVIWSQP